MTPHGHFHWNELMTNDVEKARAFYHDSVGWEFDGVDMPDGTLYWVAMDGETPIAGMFQMQGPEFAGVTDHWVSYVSVDDIDERVAKAKVNGATVTQEPFDVEGVGRIAMLQEPGGAHVGWMTPAENG